MGREGLAVTLTATLAVATIVLGTALAQPTEATIALPAAQIIAARQAAFDTAAVTFGSLRTAVAEQSDVKRQEFAAESLAKWAKALPLLFPKGTGIGDVVVSTHAKPEIWSDRAGFEKAAADYLAATTKAAGFAHAGDAGNFKAQVGEIKNSCDACHQTFKSKDP